MDLVWDITAFSVRMVAAIMAAGITAVIRGGIMGEVRAMAVTIKTRLSRLDTAPFAGFSS